MSNNNRVYPLVGPRYPLFIPVDPAKSKRKWLPWGRRPPQILSLGDRESGAYFRKRGAAARTNQQNHPYDDPSDSYPKIVSGLIPEEDN